MFIYIQYSILNQYMIDVHSLKVNLVIGIGIIKIVMMFISAELQKCTHFKSNYLVYYFLAGWIFLFSLDIGRFTRECTCQDVIALKFFSMPIILFHIQNNKYKIQLYIWTVRITSIISNAIDYFGDCYGKFKF